MRAGESEGAGRGPLPRRGGAARAVVLALGAALLWLDAPPARAQTNSGIGAPPGSAADRFRKAREGAGTADFLRRTNDPDPAVRAQALKSLAESGDPRAKDAALEALDDADARVQNRALECLVELRAADVAPALLQRLFLAATPRPVRRRILAVLAEIAEPPVARDLLDYAGEETDAELRVAALYAVGQVGDASLEAPLRALADRESDPAVKRIAADAAAAVAARAAAGSRR
ncbi:MAG: HEAT repeat domain-containing protein [Deltaproteobacteria bacterium]|nr:HEAT repeat domain-containing protein [Deltaproteobacteria bacterium]